MKAITPNGDAEIVDAAIEQVVYAVNIALARFREKLDEVEALETTTKDADVQKAIVRLREQYLVLVSERHKLNGKRDGKFGAGAVEPIDTDAARAEIGRLLDRIRHAGDPGSLPE